MKCTEDVRNPAQAPAFVRRAERVLRSAARDMRTQDRALRLLLIVWQDDKGAVASA